MNEELTSVEDVEIIDLPATSEGLNTPATLAIGGLALYGGYTLVKKGVNLVKGAVDSIKEKRANKSKKAEKTEEKEDNSKEEVVEEKN